VNIIGGNFTRLNNLFDFDNGDFGGFGTVRVEVTGRRTENTISVSIGFPGFD
jgi:hypothetical protein